ncbi:MAG: hypothetical protein ABFC89_08955 [Methanospirillum sp.]
MSDVYKTPDVSKEKIGERLYQLTKQKSAEKACEKIRMHLGVRWSEFDDSEVNELKVILEEAWTCCDGTVWDRIEFHNLSYDDVRKLLNTRRWSGDSLSSRQRNSDEVLRLLVPAV